LQQKADLHFLRLRFTLSFLQKIVKPFVVFSIFLAFFIDGCEKKANFATKKASQGVKQREAHTK
jgi:hypothetical protein